MDIASFEDLVDRHGGDLARWPAPERASAEALLAASPDARALLAEIRDVEAALHRTSWRDEAGAIERMAARASAGRQETRVHRIALRAGVGAAAAAVLALGVLVGGSVGSLGPAPAAHEMSADRVLAAALDSGGAGDVD